MANNRNQLAEESDEDKQVVCRQMVNYYRRWIVPVFQTTDRQDALTGDQKRQLTDTMRIRLTADQFDKVMRRRDTTPLNNILDRFLYKCGTGKDVKHELGERYGIYLTDNEEYRRRNNLDGEVTIDYPSMRTIVGYPELGGTPDARATVNNNQYVAIFHDVARTLASRNLTSLEDGIRAGVLPILYDQEDNKFISRRHSANNEAQGLLAAFPEAQCCHFVLFGRDQEDIDITVINRINFADDMAPKLERFYFAAMLPELTRPWPYIRRNEFPLILHRWARDRCKN